MAEEGLAVAEREVALLAAPFPALASVPSAWLLIFVGDIDDRC